MTDEDSIAPSFSDGSLVSSDFDEIHSEPSKSSEGETHSNTSGTNNGDSVLQSHDQENKLVRSSKACVYAFLLVVAIGGSLLVWAFLRQVQQVSVRKQFDLMAQEIIAVSTINAFGIFSHYEAEALQMTTNARATGQEWPFFTLFDFVTEAELLVNQTKTGKFMALHPLVELNQRKQWENYSISNLGWVYDAQVSNGVGGNVIICPEISKEAYLCVAEDSSPENVYAPVWQIAPAVGDNLKLINVDGFAIDGFTTAFEQTMQSRRASISHVTNLNNTSEYPESLLLTPIRQNRQPDSPIVAVLSAVIPWNDYLENLLPEGEDGIVVVISNERQQFTFEINGPHAHYLGPGDLHNPVYSSFVIANDFANFTGDSSTTFGYNLTLYPTQQFEDDHTQNHPRTYTLAVAFVFLFATSVFLVYDFFVERRQTRVLMTANRSNAIVNALFPANVRDRLMEEHETATKDKQGTNAFTPSRPNIGGLSQSSKPIADLFTEATVMFADIAGFTAWSSIREPSQVFLLLETVYNAFDKICRKMKVFKVETIGDSYVAVAGLPTPRPDHAEVMTRFAHKCLVKMNALVDQLEITLGPGTSELKMRVGLHSGPVTAGVLRGEKSRFQLFGDTVNTAARMESTGQKNRIQLSSQTANLLVAAGKEHWVCPRATKVFAKGKGELQTYWYLAGSASDTGESAVEYHTSTRGHSDDAESLAPSTPNPNGTVSDVPPLNQRLITWNVENMAVPLKKLIASRKGKKMPSLDSWRKIKIRRNPDKIVLDELEEFITMTEHGVTDLSDAEDTIVLDDVVIKQLKDYVTTTALMYRPNAFHSFDHASHVAQSVTKLLSRIVTPEQICYDSTFYTQKAAPQLLHDFTFGITSDPLIQFAVIFAALIHDADHPGVPNATLVKEGGDMAKTYRNKSVAEQNSVDAAWGLLMEPQYEDLRRCIYCTQEELESFRKLVVNAVLATDVVDKELGALRRKRWELAFENGTEECSPLFEGGAPCRQMMNRKATIIIEYMIQASDVAHTMQHWQIYTYWNERFFQECFEAYKSGRADKDPVQSWYEGELAFFDYYVLPLARRLKECGVFGVSGEEYLNYALSNRDEWSRRGKNIVDEYVQRLPSDAGRIR